MKILQLYKVFYPDVYGGVPYIMDAIRGIGGQEVEHELLVCSTNAKEKVAGVSRIRSFGELLSLPIAPLYPFALIRKLKSADITILHSPFPLGDLVFGLGFGKKTRLIIFWHSEIVRQRWILPFLRPLIMRTLNRADKILVSHQCVFDSSPMLAPFYSKVSVAPFPIDNSNYALTEGRMDAVEKIASRYKNRLVVACGRLVSYKGFDVLIEAASKVDAYFVIIGEGADRIQLQAQIERLGLSGRVILRGSLSQDELITHLHAANIFVLPSVSAAETFGIAQLEAMACSCPVVNTRLPTAVPDVARNDIEALTVTPGNAHELAEAINKLLKNEGLSLKLGQQGAVRVKQNFTPEIFKSKIESLLSN